jgi:sulfonate transport system ATP-binding protein
MASVLRQQLSPLAGVLARPRPAARVEAYPLPPHERGLGVALHGVSKDFGARTVLRNISIDIAPGQFVAVVGRSGSGKSTLLRLLAGLEEPDSGQVLLGGRTSCSRTAACCPGAASSRMWRWD